MKEKIFLSIVMVSSALPVYAGINPQPDSATPLPEPSTIGLFAAAAIAITVLSKLKK